LAAAYDTFNLLVTNPELGRRRRFRSPRLRNVRSFRVSGFVNYLIFYRTVSEGIQVLHVFHGAQDLEALFEDR
jgi:toxin ParE1/3/4